MAPTHNVKEIWAIVERVATGGSSYTTGEQELVNWLTDDLGLHRSPETYARRTRQRYQAASRRGLTAAEINREEYERRGKRKAPFKGGTPSEPFSRKLRRLIERRNVLLPKEPVDVDYVMDYVQIFGESNVIDLLEQQIDSCEQYQRHDSGPGHERWEERNPTNPDNIRADFTTYIGNTDVMYYYHSNR